MSLLGLNLGLPCSISAKLLLKLCGIILSTLEQFLSLLCYAVVI